MTMPGNDGGAGHGDEPEAGNESPGDGTSQPAREKALLQRGAGSTLAWSLVFLLVLWLLLLFL